MTNGKERPAKRGLCGEAQAGGLTKPAQLRPGSSLTWPALTPRMERPHISHTNPGMTCNHTFSSEKSKSTLQNDQFLFFSFFKKLIYRYYVYYMRTILPNST